jgi:hypothetical protein
MFGVEIKIRKTLMKCVSITTYLGLLFFLFGCKTNPPSSPENVIPTGNAKLKIKLTAPGDNPQSTKVVLLEDFANVSCVPCVTSNRIIESLSNYTYGRSKLLVVKFPTDFPSPNDPFYLTNPETCEARMSYYQILFAPTTIIDGLSRPVSTDSVSIKSAVDTRLAVSPRFGVDVNAAFEGDYLIDVFIAVIDTTGINPDDLVIHCVITETDIEFDEAPGSNGEKKFYDVMRLMLPTLNGEPLRNLINTGEINYEFSDALLSNWNLEKINTVVFIQNKNTREVFQAGSTFK